MTWRCYDMEMLWHEDAMTWRCYDMEMLWHGDAMTWRFYNTLKTLIIRHKTCDMMTIWKFSFEKWKIIETNLDPSNGPERPWIRLQLEGTEKRAKIIYVNYTLVIYMHTPKLKAIQTPESKWFLVPLIWAHRLAHPKASSTTKKPNSILHCFQFNFILKFWIHWNWKASR